MKVYIFFLVTAYFLGTTFAQLSADDLRCSKYGTDADCKTGNCTWCPNLSFCRLKTCIECNNCLNATKIEVKCSNGLLAATKCDPTTCSFVAEPCPPDVCTCTAAIQANARMCPNGVTIEPRCSVETNCSWVYPICPGCDGCLTVKVPDTVTSICSDGTSTKPYCDDVTCTWKIPECPTNGSASVCPAGVPVVQCFVSPCSITETSPNYNPLSVTCKENYCGGCNANCYDANGNEVKCFIEVPVPVGCTEDKCPATKPITDCANAKIYCGPSLTATTSLTNTTTSVTRNLTCEWKVYCPLVPSVCDANSCGVNNLASVAICPSGQKPEWSCTSIEVSGSVTQCAWISKCPIVVEPIITCTVGGVCGDRCVPSSVETLLDSINATLCRKSTTCAQKCSIEYKIAESCRYQKEFGCQFSFSDGYYECLKRCDGIIVEPPTCSGTICDCDYNSCYSCILDYKLESGRTISKSVCASTTYGDACSAFGGSAVLAKPERCAIEQPVSDAPREILDVVNKLKELNITNVRDRIENLIGLVKEARDFIVTVKLSTEPKVQDGKFSFDVILSVDGSREPTQDEKKSICDNLLIPAVRDTAKITDSLQCTMDKVTTGTAKRATSGSQPFAAQITSGTGTTPDSGASTVVLSLTALAVFVVLAFL